MLNPKQLVLMAGLAFVVAFVTVLIVRKPQPQPASPLDTIHLQIDSICNEIKAVKAENRKLVEQYQTIRTEFGRRQTVLQSQLEALRHTTPEDRRFIIELDSLLNNDAR